jgi:hypothetical protein
MGGFVYHGDNGPLRMLSLQDIEELVKKDEIEYPIISKEEIKDKSKGDALTKGLVLIQTTWFLLQCVARGVQHLSLTELEFPTAAFALLNSHICTLVGQASECAPSCSSAEEACMRPGRWRGSGNWRERNWPG